MSYLRRAILAFALIAGIAPAFAQAPPPIPGLPDSERRTSYSISATTCICNVNFALFGDSTDFSAWVEVYLNGVLLSSSDPTFGWTITSPTGPLATIPRPVTDAVLTFTNAQTGTVQIVGARRPRRVSQFAENRGVAARDLNQAVTDITATLREMWDKTNDVTGRALLSQPGVTLALLPLPTACQGKFLGFDVTGLIPTCTAGGAGAGNVVGPASSTDGDFALFNGTSGALLKDAPTTVIQSALQNRVWASPNGSTGAPAFRLLVGPDLPTPGASSLGGVQSSTCGASTWVNALSTLGVLGCTQPNFTDLAGSIAGGQIGTGIITSTMILDGTILNADINAGAAIALTKLATIAANTIVGSTAGGTPAALNGAQAGSILCLPNRQVLTTGTNATYTTPTCNAALPTRIEWELEGGGGGGAGSGTTPGAATAGGATCVNTSGTACTSSLFQANGGAPGQAANGVNSAGGTTAGCDLGIVGGIGSGAANIANGTGGAGGASYFGGQAPANSSNGAATAGGAAAANSGGGGAGASSAATVGAGGGGAAGGYCRKTQTSPASTYVYTIGPNGSGGTLGTSGAAGGNGATGLAIATAYWQ